MDGIPPHPAADRAAPRDRAPPVAGGGVVRRGRGEPGPRPVAQPRVGVAPQREVDGEALGPRGLGTPRADAGAGGLIRHLLADRGQVVRAGGLLDLGEARGSCAPAGYPAPEESTGGAPLRGGDGGLREQAPTPEPRDVLGLDAVVCGGAAMAGWHGAGRPQDDGTTRPSTQVSPPGPRAETCHANAEVLLSRREGLENRFGSCLHRAVQPDLPSLIQDTEGPWCGRAGRCHHNTGAASCRIACGLLLFSCVFSPYQHTTVVWGGGGLNTYQSAAADCLQRPLRSRFRQQLSASVRPAETVHLWSWEEEESFTLEIRIESDRLL